MIHAKPFSFIFDDAFVDLPAFVERGRVILKLEGFSLTGSIKIKAATSMIADAEEQYGPLSPATTIIESTSGNMGVAMASVCAARGYNFVCVSDPNISLTNKCAIEAYGARLIVVTERDKNGGYVETRLDAIQAFLSENPTALWLNQYANPANKGAHFRTTAPRICKHVPDMSWFFCGVGTSGTFTGCAEYFREHKTTTKIIAVDTVGSTTFGGPPKRRLIPGIGNSRPPELANSSLSDEVVHIEEIDAIDLCRETARKHGLLLGGSSGSVLAAVRQYANQFTDSDTIVAISPDFGEKYLETIYSDTWVKSNFVHDDGRSADDVNYLRSSLST